VEFESCWIWRAMLLYLLDYSYSIFPLYSTVGHFCLSKFHLPIVDHFHQLKNPKQYWFDGTCIAECSLIEAVFFFLSLSWGKVMLR